MGCVLYVVHTSHDFKRVVKKRLLLKRASEERPKLIGSASYMTTGRLTHNVRSPMKDIYFSYLLK